MSEADAWKIAKWILIVLVAGFIGQFGKMLASHLINEARNRREKNARAPGLPSHETYPPLTPTERDKAEGKKETAQKEDPSRKREDELKTEEKARKKELKAEAKIKKKETKEKEKNAF